VIVMLANEIENGKEKVYPYWPEESDLTLELFKIQKGSVDKSEFIINRHFTLTHIESDVTRNISQFQYIGWPDQGLPPNTDGFSKVLDLVDEVINPIADNKPPVLVHCSAGIGRTGVFCAVHSTITKFKNLLANSTTNKTISAVNLKDLVLRMREERAGMIQTQEQYAFCYMSLVDKLTEILKIMEYKNEGWYHKGLDLEHCTQLLEGKPHGSFLFRSSSTPGCIVLSAVNGKSILNARIEVSFKGFTLENEIYPTIAKLVESRHQVLVHPILRTK